MDGESPTCEAEVSMGDARPLYSSKTHDDTTGFLRLCPNVPFYKNLRDRFGAKFAHWNLDFISKYG